MNRTIHLFTTREAVKVAEKLIGQISFMSEEKENSKPRFSVRNRIRPSRGRWSDNDLLLFVQSLLNSVNTEENFQVNLSVMEELFEAIKDFRERKPNWYFILEKIPASSREDIGNN